MLSLAGCGLLGDPDERRLFPSEPKPQEYQYLELARQMASEKACYLISRNSVSVMPLNSPGTRAQSIRSQCFSEVAKRSARPEPCESVVAVSTLLYSGHRNNRGRCIQAAGQSRPSAAVGIIDHDAMFQLAGLSNEDINRLMQEYELAENGRYCLIFSPEFFEAVERMPRFSSADDREKMKTLQWKPHPFLGLPGFACHGKFPDSTQAALNQNGPA